MSILELRQMTGLSQRKFANKYQINFRNIQNWEQGVSKLPAYVIHMLYRLITEVDHKEQ